jgi:hypothetical protein
METIYRGKDIVTKNKERFLKSEWNHYKVVFKDYDEFLKVMLESLRKCETCGVYYWEGCQKRCKHK